MTAVDSAPAETAEWTLNTLRIYLTALIDGLDRQTQQAMTAQKVAVDAALAAADRAVAAALAAAEKAVAKAEGAAERRFEGVNEFRKQLSDQASTFYPREAAEQRLGDLAGKIESMGTRLDTMQGQGAGRQELHAEDRLDRGSLLALLAVLVAVAAIVVTITLHH